MDVRYLGSLDAWHLVDWVGHCFGCGALIRLCFWYINLLLEAHSYNASAGSVFYKQGGIIMRKPKGLMCLLECVLHSSIPIASTSAYDPSPS